LNATKNIIYGYLLTIQRYQRNIPMLLHYYIQGTKNHSCKGGLYYTMSGRMIFGIVMIVFWSIMLACPSNLFADLEDVKIA
ncbi:MAG TPA: hypothetical protein VHJ59_06920, partial [Nitrososphaera sp.]|nr:hypothetical protein [Nitrososphaera sp.]